MKVEMKRKLFWLIGSETFVVFGFLLFYWFYWKYGANMMLKSPLNYFLPLTIFCLCFGVLKLRAATATAATCAIWLGTLMLAEKASAFIPWPTVSFLVIFLLPLLVAGLPIFYWTLKITDNNLDGDSTEDDALDWIKIVNRSLWVALIIYAFGFFFLVQWAYRNYGS
jgi:hypothetical protein